MGVSKMSRGIAIWSICCMVFAGYVGLFAMVSMLAEGSFLGALLALGMGAIIYLVVFHVGVLFLNVMGVASDVLDVNVKESRKIRGKE
jgi:hypothetical protein